MPGTLSPVPTMLHSRLLTYVDEVARTGSIRKAASHLNVAASAISRQILALEAQLGTPIFQRLPKKLILTAAGEVLIGHVRQTLKELTRAQAKIEELKGLRRGEITVALMSGLASNLVPGTVKEFRLTNPRVKLGFERFSPPARKFSPRWPTAKPILGDRVRLHQGQQSEGARPRRRQAGSLNGPDPSPCETQRHSPQRLHGLPACGSRQQQCDQALSGRRLRACRT